MDAINDWLREHQISEVEALVPDLERRGYALEVEVQPAAAGVPVDADALDGVLRNLVDNAVKFSPEVKHIRIEAMPVPNGSS